MEIKKKEIQDYSIKELAELYRSKSLSPVEVTTYLLKRINEQQPKINAFITITEGLALEQAKASEERFKLGRPLSILDGIPYCAKDLIYTKGIKTTMGSPIFKDFIPDENAQVIDKLHTAGAILLGKANTQQFALGATGEVSCAGPCRNPYDNTKISGGSSSGSAAAVGAKLCPFALGTDTGGSVRAPSALCGVVGMRPTTGRITTRGIFPNSYHYDSVGIITRTAEDNAIVMNILAGYDEDYQYSLNSPMEDFTSKIKEPSEKLIVGVPYSYFEACVADYVYDSVQNTVEKLKEAGAEMVEVELPDILPYREIQSKVQMAEAYCAHKQLLEDHRDLYDEEILGRLEIAKNIKAEEYIDSINKMFQFQKVFDSVFDKIDLLLLPTQPVVAFNLGTKGELDIKGRKMAIFDASSRPLWFAAFRGLPAINVPSGFYDGLPIGLQIIGPPKSESKVYELADKVLSLI